jgi:hypothetical protein
VSTHDLNADRGSNLSIQHDSLIQVGSDSFTELDSSNSSAEPDGYSYKQDSSNNSYQPNNDKLDYYLNAFCKKFDVEIDTCSPLIADMDFSKLTAAYVQSPQFLQVTPVCKTLSWVVKNYNSIVAGKYRQIERDNRYRYGSNRYGAEASPRSTEIYPGEIVL